MAKKLNLVSGVDAGASGSPAVSFDNSNYVAAGATKTLAYGEHMSTVKWDTATGGSTVTLPAATGSGAKFRFVVSTLATSPAGHIVKVGNTTDVMQGIVAVSSTDLAPASTAFAANATSDTITLNAGNKTGNTSKGEWVEVQDYASGIWQVSGQLSTVGTPATPFSATV